MLDGIYGGRELTDYRSRYPEMQILAALPQEQSIAGPRILAFGRASRDRRGTPMSVGELPGSFPAAARLRAVDRSSAAPSAGEFKILANQ
jgi:hypothetical protein